jgi:CelD/BcsL family acetyltransferase involved in cellulose biosynthesis
MVSGSAGRSGPSARPKAEVAPGSAGRRQPGVTVRWTDDLETVEGLHDAWSSLLGRATDAPVFVGHDWVAASLRAVVGRRIAVAAAFAGEELVGVLPLTIGREWLHGVPVCTAREAGHPLTDRFAPLADPLTPGVVEALLDAAADLPVDLLILSEVPETVWPSLRRWLADRTMPAVSRVSSEVRLTPVDAASDAELDRSYPAKYRQRRGRSRRRIEQQGKLAIEAYVPTAEEIPALIARAQQIEARAWQGAAGSGLFSQEARRRFALDAFSRMAAHGNVAIGILTLDSEDAMYILGTVHRDSFGWYNTAQLPDRLRGTGFILLIHDLMTTLHPRGVRLIDSSRTTPGTQTPLDELSHRRLLHRRFVLFRRTPAAWAYRLVLQRLWPSYRSLRARLRPRASTVVARAWTEEPADVSRVER